MGKTLIECGEVEFRADGKLLLGPISMRIEEGDYWGVVGPNGAGKSTLLRVLSGQLRPTAGRVKMGYVSIGFMLQHHNYSEQLPFRVRDVVGFGVVDARSFGVGLKSQKRKLVADAISRLGLESIQNRLYRELSGGEQRKVQFARLAAQGAKLDLLDEPTAGLDLDWQERVTELAARFHVNSGRTIVMVTHDVDRLPDCCNKVLLLKQGRALRSGGPSEVFQPHYLSELYGCEVEVVERAGRFHAFSSARVVSSAMRGSE